MLHFLIANQCQHLNKRLHEPFISWANVSPIISCDKVFLAKYGATACVSKTGDKNSYEL